jgi:radical SAM protein with 4Fe4S-binding SPASM domain
MTMDTLRRVLDQAVGRASTITIGNHGEPFLHKDIFKIIEEIKKKGFFLNIINNGTLLNEEKGKRLLTMGVDRLTFSIDSVDPVQYPLIRKGANYKRVMKNILCLIKNNYEAGLPLYINISTVNTKQALQSSPPIEAYFKKLPVHVIYTSDLLNFHDKLPVDDQTYFSRKYRKISNPSDWPVCLNGFDRLLIRPNGNVSLCALDWESIHILGNVNEAPYYELWNNEKAQEFRRALLTRDYSTVEKDGKVLCSRCDGKWSLNLATYPAHIQSLIASDLKDAKRQCFQQVHDTAKYRNLLYELGKFC